MHRQYDKRYNPIGQEGCYFISLGVWAEELAHKVLTDEQVLETYVESVSTGDLEINCRVNKPADIINRFLKKLGNPKRVRYIGWWNKDTGPEFWGGCTSKDFDFEILRVSTPYGKHFKTPGFNPWPELEQSSEIDGRRFFKVV